MKLNREKLSSMSLGAILFGVFGTIVVIVLGGTISSVQHRYGMKPHSSIRHTCILLGYY